MSYVKTIFQLIFYYEKDKCAGVPYWKDPTLIGAVVGLLASILASAAGINIDSDLQLKIVGAAVGIGALFSPYSGLKAKKPDKGVPQSCFPDPDHGGDH